MILTGCNYVEQTLSVFCGIALGPPCVALPGARATNFWPHPWWPKTWTTYLGKWDGVFGCFWWFVSLRYGNTCINVISNINLEKMGIQGGKQSSNQQFSRWCVSGRVVNFIYFIHSIYSNLFHLFHLFHFLVHYNSWRLKSGYRCLEDQESLVQFLCLKPFGISMSICSTKITSGVMKDCGATVE